MVDRNSNRRSRSKRPRPDPPSTKQPSSTTAKRGGFPQGSTFKAAGSPPPDPNPDIPEPPYAEVTEEFFRALADVYKRIESERQELRQIYGMAFCLCDVLKYSDDDDADQHSDVALVISRLLDDVITNLELIKLSLPINREDAEAINNESDKDVAI